MPQDEEVRSGHMHRQGYRAEYGWEDWKELGRCLDQCSTSLLEMVWVYGDSRPSLKGGVVVYTFYPSTQETEASNL